MSKTKRRITRLNKNHTIKNRATKKATRRLGRKGQKGGVPHNSNSKTPGSSSSFTSRSNPHQRGYNDAARDQAATKLWGNDKGFFGSISSSFRSGVSKLFSRKPK
jgi:hypothetical protein